MDEQLVDETIRAKVQGFEGVRLMAADDSLAEAADLRAREAARLDEIAERSQVIQALCGKFAVWAHGNHIPYNSPSPLAQGWLLGERTAGPSRSFSGYGVSSVNESASSLLVKSNGSIKELVVRDATKTFGKRKYHLFASEAYLGGYAIDSVIESVARYSQLSGKTWPD